MVIYREARGDEDAAADSFSSTLQQTGTSLTFGKGDDLIAPVRGAMQAAITANNGGFVNATFSGLDLSSVWLSFYFKATKLFNEDAKYTTIAQIGSATPTAWANYFIVIQDGTSHYFQFVNSRWTTPIVLNKTYQIDLYVNKDNGSNNIANAYATDGTFASKLICNNSLTSQANNITYAVLGVYYHPLSAAATKVLSYGFAGMALTDTRRGHLRMRRGRTNRCLPNSDETWRHGVRRGKETGLVMV